jgi:hypothetical protein
MRLIAAAVIASVALVSQASADSYKLVVVGTVGSITSFNDSFMEVTRETSFHVGDVFSGTYVFDTSSYDIVDIFEPDDTSTYYQGSLDALQVAIGSFNLTYGVGDNVSSSIAVGNNIPLDTPTDVFGITADHYLGDESTPVAFETSGPYRFATYFNAFDFTGLARASDSIMEITSLDRFAHLTAAVEFRDSGNLGTLVVVNIASARIVPLQAVPEPATWALMLVGFGMIGATTRYRRRATNVTYA